MRAAAANLARRQARLLGLQVRSFASAAEVAVVEDSPFLRFATPVPQQYSFQNVLGSIPETKVTRLSNGVRVATQATPFAETATVGVWIDAGSRYENDANNGTAHFLEHMAFKGTKSRSKQQIEVQVENMGAHLNAYTSREQTCYYANVFKKDVPAAVDILSDILQSSTLDAAAIDRERDVILREMQEIEAMPQEVVFDHLHATAFQQSPLGRTILGPAENIRSITREDLAAYITANYTANRMVVSGAGAVDHEELVKLSEKAFSNLSTDPTTAEDLCKQQPAFFTGSEVRVRDPDMPLVHFAVAFKGASWADPDSVPLMVAQTMIGSYNRAASASKHLASGLAQKAYSNELCDSFMAFNTNYHDTGLFGIYAVADKHAKLDDLAWSMMYELTKLAYEVEEADVQRAKNQLKASFLFTQDSTGGVAEDIGRSLLVYGRRIPKAELFARIDAVTADTIRDVGQRFIFDQDIAVAAMGDVQTLPDYTFLRRRTYWLSY